MKRIFALLLAFVMLLPSSAVSALAANDGGDCVISVKDASAMPGSTVSVDITVENNPGIQGATLVVSWDAGLTLTKKAQNGAAFSALGLTAPTKLSSPYNLVWFAQDLEPEDIKDGVIATLEFKVSPQAKNGDRLTVSVTSEYGDIVDCNKRYLSPRTENGTVSVATYIPGNVNGDGRINALDLIDLSQYIADGCKTDPDSYNVSLNPNAGDVDDSGRLNALDLILISQYIADDCKTDPESYNVKLVPSTHDFGHTHTLQATAYKAATCTADGHIAYWYCEGCGKYFSNSAATAEITFADTKIEHHHLRLVDIPATATTTAGQKCDACGVVTIEPQTIAGDEYEIRYEIANGVDYIEALVENGKLTNPNPVKGQTNSDLWLEDLRVDGYQFKGWFYEREGGTAVEKIPSGTTGIVKLFAHWELKGYTIQFKSSVFLEEKEMVYTADKGAVLPTPKLSNYVFTGWSDENGHLYKSSVIPAGTTGNITLTANWTSERNKTWTKTKLDDPIIYEDEENNTILFAYEIGEIQNVPLYTIKDFGYISGDGVTKTATETYSTTITETTMQNFAKSVASATTQSSNWTLADEWSESTHVDSEWCKENGYEEEEANTVSRTDEKNWNISSGTSGSTETTIVDSDQNDLRSEAKIGNSTTNANKVSENYKYSDSKTASLNTTLDIGVSTTASVENTSTISGKLSANLGVNKSGASAGVGAEVGASNSLKTGLSTTVSSDLKTETGYSSTHDEEHGGGSEQEHKQVRESENTDSRGVTTLHSNSSTSTSSWNSSSSYGGSSANTVSKSTSVALSEKISEKTGYGESYIQGGSSSTTQGHSNTSTSEDEYSVSSTYSKVTGKTVTSTWTTQSTKAGYHRWIVAGTAHVFAVVGYNMATESYFVYTYNIMDDETHEFEDYSYTTAAYNDNENGVIPFEIPGFVNEYVANRVNRTDGLKINIDTGTITGYNGDYSCVVIPEYMNIGNGDVVKVTGISKDAFRGNTNIKVVILSDYITEIPDNAFAGCTSLIGIGANSVTKIGDNAFAGCVSFKEAYVPASITEVGRNAFSNVEKLTVIAHDADAVTAAVNSGARKIIVNLEELESGVDVLNGKTITVPARTEYFELNGDGRTFRSFTVVSDAAETVINKVNLAGTGSIPLQVSSPKLTLNQSTINATGIAMVLSSETTNVGLQGTIAVGSQNVNTLLCKNVQLYESNSSANGLLAVAGNVLICGTMSGQKCITYDDIKYIDTDTFERMLRSYRIYFDANGGSCNMASMEATPGTPIGTLPAPTRQYYTFDGWYLADGTRVTASTVFASGADQHLTARWSPIYVTSLQITNPAEKLEYYAGDNFSAAGMQLKAIYNDGSEKMISYQDCTISSPKLEAAGMKTVNVTYGGVSISYDVTVKDLTISVSCETSTATNGYITFSASIPCGTVNWTSSDTKIATVDASGKIVFGSKMGSATITATVVNGNCSKSVTKILNLSNTGGTKYKETTSSSTANVLYATRPSGYTTSLPVATGSIPSYSTNSADITDSTSNTSTGKVVTSYKQNGINGYVYYQFNYNSGSGGSNENKIINYQEGWRYNLAGDSDHNYYYYTSYGRQFYSATNYPEHEANANWSKYYAIWWAYQDKQAGHTWYVASGISGALAASWYRFPVYNYTKTTTTYTYYYYSVS